MIRLLLVLLVPAIGTTQITPFSCTNRPSGYYADISTGCQVYHMCDGLGRQFSYSCPNATLFQQRMLICDHWYMVNCNQSEDDYQANLRIGQKDRRFVDDSEQVTYQRTPRPDLFTGFRSGRAQFSSNSNLVGAEIDVSDKDKANSNKIFYVLPSHWFMEYKGNIAEDKTKEKHIASDNIAKINDNNINKKEDNYKSKPKPLFKESLEKKKVEPLKDIKENIIKANVQKQSHDFSPNESINKYTIVTRTSTESNVLNSNFITPILPYKPHIQNNEHHWKNLRNFFLIPDYEFPLEQVNRPGYDSGHSSFDVESKIKV